MNILNCFQNDYTRWRAILSRFYHMERHLVTASPPPPPPTVAFLGAIRRGAQRPCTFQHSKFDSNKGRAKGLRTFYDCLFIFLDHAEVGLATFLFSGAYTFRMTSS